MNKTHWLGVLLDGSAEDETVTELLDLSYGQTQAKRKSKTAACNRFPALI
jgi:predicted DNA-binding protein (MmcQ/YjbR family)